MRFHGRYHVTGSLLVSRRVNAVTSALRLGRSRYVRWRQALEQVLESERRGTYGFPHCSQTLLLRRVGSLPSKTGPLVCPASNRYQPKLSFPVYFEPSIHFTLPIGNDAGARAHERRGLFGRHPVHIQQQPGRRDPREMRQSGRA